MSAISSTISSGPYAGTGAQTVFPFDFTAASALEVGAKVDDVDVGGFSVALNGTGGSVTFTTPPANGTAVLLYSKPDFTQASTFESEGDYDMETVNRVNQRSAIRDLVLLDRVGKLLPDFGASILNLAGKFLSWDAGGNPIVASGTGADAGLRTDAAASSGSSLVGFLQSGTGATSRTVQDKLRDTVSTADYDTLTHSADALASGGAMDVVATSANGQQFFAPSRGNVHNFDYATIGTTDVLTNGTFTGSPATGWTLANFTSANPTLTHSTGSIASAKRSVSVVAYTTYLIRVTITTTTRGGIACYLAGTNIFNADDVSVLPVQGSTVYEFTLFSYATTGTVDFELRTDNLWAGTLSKIELIRIQREAPYDSFSIAADHRSFDNVFGIKYGRFLSGNIAIGDRLTSGLLTYDAAWNVAMGSRALSTNTSQFENVAIGCFALEFNQTDRNTALGYSAMRYNTKGIQNTALGYKTFGANSTGNNNTGVGFWASLYNKTASNNTSVGYLANYYNQYGDFNTAVGSQAGTNNDGGTGNTYVGAICGPYNIGAVTFAYSNQVCVGAESKAYGNNNTAVGESAQCGTDPNSAGTAITNATAVGYQAAATKNNQVVIGNTSVAETVLQGVVRAVKTYTVAGLPSAATMGAGARTFVTDANATTFAATVAGGGANGVPVYSDGTNWKIG